MVNDSIAAKDVQKYPSPEEFFQAQCNDAKLQCWIKRHTEDSTTKIEPELIPSTDTNLQLWADSSKNPPCILVPTSLQRATFDHFHNFAHMGSKATTKTIKASHFWPNMGKDITNWCKECLVCHKNKVLKHTKSPTQQIPIPTSRFSHIHVDLVGPLPRCSGKNVLFTIIDRTTGWPEAIPLESTNAKHCTEIFIQNWISRFGVPQTITSCLLYTSPSPRD